MGLRGQDLLDAQQEVVMVVMLFKYDPSNANGASERTVLTLIIDRRLQALRRGRRRSARREEAATDTVVAAYHERRRRDSSMQRVAGLSHDVRRAIASLTPVQRLVCVLLGRGNSIASHWLAYGRTHHRCNPRALHGARPQRVAHGEVNRTSNHLASHPPPVEVKDDADGLPELRVLPATSSWISDELLARTRRVWSKVYGRLVDDSEAREILMNVKRFAEAMMKAGEGVP